MPSKVSLCVSKSGVLYLSGLAADVLPMFHHQPTAKQPRLILYQLSPAIRPFLCLIWWVWQTSWILEYKVSRVYSKGLFYWPVLHNQPRVNPPGVKPASGDRDLQLSLSRSQRCSPWLSFSSKMTSQMKRRSPSSIQKYHVRRKKMNGRRQTWAVSLM